MNSWRITKYNPKYRNKNGSYTLNEWTSYHDIGKVYEGRVFAFEEYLAIENAYINAIMAFLVEFKVKLLNVKELTKYSCFLDKNGNTEPYSDRMSYLFNSLKNNDSIYLCDVENLARLILREYLWCKLEDNSKTFIHFGYDFYMYIGGEINCKQAIDITRQNGLFVEEFKSPYIQ